MSRSAGVPGSADGRISDAIIASVKNNTSFLSLLRNYGIEAAKKGKGYLCICPFHQVDGHPEKTSSLSIDTINNLYHCFSCNARGNVIQFVMEMDKITFPEAVEKLLAVKPQLLKRREQKSNEPASENPPPAPMSEEERQAILREVVQRSVADLRSSESGRKYLENRGLDPLKLLESYTFGYWNGRTFANLESGERENLKTIGLVKDNRALFENCIVFPLNKDGRFTTVYGRKTETTSGPACRHYLLPCKREGLFLPEAGLNPRRPVVITESIIDGLSLFAAGVTNVLPLLGVNGFLPDHLEYLKRQTFPMVHIALNGDDAGNKAAAQLRQNLSAQSIPAKIIELPENKDFNDLLLELGPNKLKEWVRERTGEKEDSESQPTVSEDEAGTIFVLFDDREYRLQGLALFGMDRLRANIKVYRMSDKNTWYLDTLDLYASRSREHFINQTAKALGVDIQTIARDVNQLITVLEDLRLRKKEESTRPKVYQMSDSEKREALEYLRSPNLLDRIAADFEACGMVGNTTVKLLAYLGALSRLTERPFGTLIVSRSGAGKSYLQDMVANMTPEELLLRMTRLTGQSLFYQGKDGLKHKLLTIEEDEGMQEAMYSIRTLLSSQKLTLHGLKTDPKTGEFKAYENTVVGPTSVMISTTNLSAFTFENVNRFFVLFLDESREQTRAILERQRSMAGLDKINLKVTRQRIEKLHRNSQRLLKPVMVINKIGTGIEYPVDILNTRREQTKTEALIETVALLHQYQREIKTERICGMEIQYIEVTKEDIELVHRIAGDILRQSLDEMPKLCRDLLGFIHEIVNEKFKAVLSSNANECLERWQISFTRKELAERSGWSRWHLEEHLKELEEAGYIVQRMGKKGQKYAYSLVEDNLPAIPNVKSSI